MYCIDDIWYTVIKSDEITGAVLIESSEGKFITTQETLDHHLNHGASMSKSLKIMLSEDQPMPKYQTEGSAGFDLVATRDCVFRSGEEIFMDLGIAMEVPVGYYASLQVRSSLGKKGLFQLCTEGIIDSDYRGNIIAMLGSRHPLTISKGQRIMQVLIKPVRQYDLEQVEMLSPTERGTGGTGSTDKQ